MNEPVSKEVHNLLDLKDFWIWHMVIFSTEILDIFILLVWKATTVRKLDLLALSGGTHYYMLSTLPLEEIESESLKVGMQNVRLKHIKWDSILQTVGQAGKQDAPGIDLTAQHQRTNKCCSSHEHETPIYLYCDQLSSSILRN
jgi:hypothetical protein